MRDRDDLEAWADALLDAHRTAPRRTQPTPEETERTIQELPPTLRFMIERGHANPDPETLARMHRLARRWRNFENVEAIVTLVGILAFCAFAFALSSGF